MPDSVPDMSDTDMMSYMMSYMIQVVNSWLCSSSQHVNSQGSKRVSIEEATLPLHW